MKAGTGKEAGTMRIEGVEKENRTASEDVKSRGDE